MVPGLAMFYGGLVRPKNVLGTMMHSFVAMCIIGVLWVVCGYAMAFGPSVLGGWIGWDPSFVLLKGIDTKIMKDYGVPEHNEGVLPWEHVTAAALEILMGKDGFEQLLKRAVAAATKRSRELAG